ncbi:MAG: DUF4159 domain-containing protein [Marinifilaceae bacterium]|jgi:hypothetical protein|nr:DUF4159 domain-containing protein [Marinifilaceae bacterium]
MLRNLSFVFFLLFSNICFSQVKIAVLKYNGGGDWYANPSSVPNLAKFCNDQNIAEIETKVDFVSVGSKDIFIYDFVHMTGHGNLVFTESEAANLRKYIRSGGFLHIDDNYGMNDFIRREIKKVFPFHELQEVPLSHSIFNIVYKFPNGLPKIHEHDNKKPQAYGIFLENKLVCLYTYETDLGDGWEDISVHNDTEINHKLALQMGANIIAYAFTKE